jgi:hypothetical protein
MHARTIPIDPILHGEAWRHRAPRREQIGR